MSDPARKAAFTCVLAVEREDAYANLIMPSVLRKARLSGRDAAFATELAYGALRMRGFYDAVISIASGRQADSLEDHVRAVLWLGAHQALDMELPAHASVSETVALAKSTGAGRASGLVNAVMRRIVERSAQEWLHLVAPGSDVPSLAIRHSHPEWIVRQLGDALAADGREGELDALLASHNRPAAVTLVARPGLVDTAELASQAHGSPTPLSPYGFALQAGSPADVPAVAQGRAGVQDEGSQLVASALAAATPIAAGERWLDACAGPGGKTALLGAIAALHGATLEALELHPHRARLVEDNCRALPTGVVSVTVADATCHEGGPYDRILLDAPCTGLGALRRRPESRWRRSPSDLTELTALQGRLIEHAAHLLAPGGVLAYVTCSPVVAETRKLAVPAGLQMIDARPVLDEVTSSHPGSWGAHPDVQLWSHVHGTDSMYVALFTKTNAH